MSKFSYNVKWCPPEESYCSITIMIKTLQASTNLAGMLFQFCNIARYFFGEACKGLQFINIIRFFNKETIFLPESQFS